MRETIIYTGCFVDRAELFRLTASLRKAPLARDIDAPHVTFAFRPSRVDTSLFGTPVELKVVGYGNDGENEGVLVELHQASPAIEALFRTIPVPHITLAVSETGKPVNTKNLQFTPVSPIVLTGVYGGYLPDGRLQLKP